LQQAGAEQLELRLRTTQLLQEWTEAVPKRFKDPKQKTRQAVATELLHEADDQDDLGKQVADILKQFDELEMQLSPAEKSRLQAAKDLLEQQQLLDEMAKTSDQLRGKDLAALPDDFWKRGAQREKLPPPRRGSASLKEWHQQWNRAAQKVEASRK